MADKDFAGWEKNELEKDLRARIGRELGNKYSELISKTKFGRGNKGHSTSSCFWLEYKFPEPIKDDNGRKILGFHIRPYRIRSNDVEKAKDAGLWGVKLKDIAGGFDGLGWGEVHYDKCGNFHKRIKTEDDIEFQVVLIRYKTNGGTPGKYDKDNMETQEMYFPKIDDDGNYSLKELVEQAAKACGLEI